MLTPDQLLAKRQAAESKLRDLRREHGAAILDGKRFDATKIAAAEAEIAALDVAREESFRRGREAVPAREAAKFAADLDRYALLEMIKLAAITEAEDAAKKLARALASAHNVNAEMVSLSGSMHLRADGNAIPGESAAAMTIRLGGLFRRELRDAGLSPFALGIQIDVDHAPALAGVAWADVEAKHSSTDGLRRLASGIADRVRQRIEQADELRRRKDNGLTGTMAEMTIYDRETGEARTIIGAHATEALEKHPKKWSREPPFGASAA